MVENGSDPAPATHGGGAPSPWVERFARLVRPGEVLDLACGAGRHARLFAALGHQVTALDRDQAALAASAGPGIRTMQYDLEAPGAAWPFRPGQFDGIVVTNYLHRPLLPRLAESLSPTGVLIYETFAIGNELFGKPSNPAFLLAPGELLGLAGSAGLRVIAYELGFVSQPKPAVVQRLCATGADFAYTGALLDHLSPQE
jgi:SAM-dependent methyltransferase